MVGKFILGNLGGAGHAILEIGFVITVVFAGKRDVGRDAQLDADVGACQLLPALEAVIPPAGSGPGPQGVTQRSGPASFLRGFRALLAALKHPASRRLEDYLSSSASGQ
jgi:hypothetical protein